MAIDRAEGFAIGGMIRLTLSKVPWLGTLTTVLVGCGPTPHEHYQKAVAIYDNERAELRRIEPDWKAIQKTVLRTAYESQYGDYSTRSEAQWSAFVERLISREPVVSTAYARAQAGVEKSNSEVIAYRKQAAQVELAREALDKAKAAWRQDREKRNNLGTIAR